LSNFLLFRTSAQIARTAGIDSAAHARSAQAHALKFCTAPPASALSILKPSKASGPSSSDGIVGSFHKVSRKYLPLYVAEFQFRYNNRQNADIFGTAIERC
jgi:hypothetical protein